MLTFALVNEFKDLSSYSEFHKQPVSNVVYNNLMQL